MIRIKIRKDLEFELPIKWLPTHWIEKQESYLSNDSTSWRNLLPPLELKKIHNKINVHAMSLEQCEVARMHCY